jgi:hypothetical protein
VVATGLSQRQQLQRSDGDEEEQTMASKGKIGGV